MAGMPQSEQARQHVEAVKALVEERKKSQENRVFAGPGFVHSRYGRGFIGQFGKGVSYRPDPRNKPLEYAKNDPTVDRQATHWWIPNSGARARLPKRANGVFSVHPQSRGAPLSMRFVGAAAVEGVEQPQEYPGAHIVLYEDAYPNIDLKATIAVKGLKIDYIFKAPGHPDYIDVQFPGPPASVAGGVRRFEEGVSRVTARDPWIDLSGIGKPGSIIYMDAEDRPGNIVRYRLPAGFSEPYPFTFDPSLQVEPDAHTETSTVDGRVTLTDAGTTFSALRNAANGSTADDTATFYNPVYSTNFTSGEYDFMGRTFMLYDTSSIGSAATINGASFWGRQSSHTDELDGHWFHIVSSAPASNTALATGDYDSLGTTPYTDGFTSGTVPSTGGRFRMQLNSSGIAAISKTGITKFGMRMINDIDNTAPTWVSDSSDSWSVSSSDSTYNSGILEVAWDCAPILTDGTDFTGTTAVTASITPTSGETVFAAVAAQGSGTFSGTTAPTISGCGLTWTLVKNSYHSGSSYWYSIWKGTGTPSTGSITFTFEASINTKCTWVILETVGQTLVYTDSWADSLLNLDSDGVAPWYPDPSLGQTSPSNGDVLGIIMGNQYGPYGGDGPFNTIEHAGTYNTYHIKGYQDGTAFIGSTSQEPVIRVIVGSGAQTEMNWGYNSASSSDWQVAAAFQLQTITQTNKIVNENVNVTESVIDIPGLAKVINETINATEAQVDLSTVMKIVNETINANEGHVTLRDIYKAINETVNLTESQIDEAYAAARKILIDMVLGTTRIPPSNAAATEILPTTRRLDG